MVRPRDSAGALSSASADEQSQWRSEADMSMLPWIPKRHSENAIPTMEAGMAQVRKAFEAERIRPLPSAPWRRPKATCWLALIWICSPVAGLRPVPGSALADLKDAEADDADALALPSRCVGDSGHEVGENRFRSASSTIHDLQRARRQGASGVTVARVAAAFFAVLGSPRGGASSRKYGVSGLG